MSKEISFTIDEEIYEKFYLALHLAKEEEAKVLEKCLKWYIAQTCEKVLKEYSAQIAEKQEPKKNEKGNFYAKAMKKIPIWAQHPRQYCHKIIRGFFKCQEQNGQVLLKDLVEVCSREEVPELYVPTFRNNYYQMKMDGAKSYGKVFEDDGKVVSIWKEIEEVLLEHKEYFIN